MKAKGNCFEANAKYFQRKAVPGWYLCHGIVINSIDKKPMVHCWIEREVEYIMEHPSGKTMRWGLTHVVDISNGNHYDGSRAAYYHAGRIDGGRVARYDLSAYIEKSIENDSYGPWDIAYDR